MKQVRSTILERLWSYKTAYQVRDESCTARGKRSTGRSVKAGKDCE